MFPFFTWQRSVCSDSTELLQYCSQHSDTAVSTVHYMQSAQWHCSQHIALHAVSTVHYMQSAQWHCSQHSDTAVSTVHYMQSAQWHPSLNGMLHFGVSFSYTQNASFISKYDPMVLTDMYGRVACVLLCLIIVGITSCSYKNFIRASRNLWGDSVVQ